LRRFRGITMGFAVICYIAGYAALFAVLGWILRGRA
jgi:hypothetical protein